VLRCFFIFVFLFLVGCQCCQEPYYKFVLPKIKGINVLSGNSYFEDQDGKIYEFVDYDRKIYAAIILGRWHKVRVNPRMYYLVPSEKAKTQRPIIKHPSVPPEKNKPGEKIDIIPKCRIAERL
jgi:hypothetical protein